MTKSFLSSRLPSKKLSNAWNSSINYMWCAVNAYEVQKTIRCRSQTGDDDINYKQRMLTRQKSDQTKNEKQEANKCEWHLNQLIRMWVSGNRFVTRLLSSRAHSSLFSSTFFVFSLFEKIYLIFHWISFFLPLKMILSHIFFCLIFLFPAQRTNYNIIRLLLVMLAIKWKSQ